MNAGDRVTWNQMSLTDSEQKRVNAVILTDGDDGRCRILWKIDADIPIVEIEDVGKTIFEFFGQIGICDARTKDLEPGWIEETSEWIEHPVGTNDEEGIE